MSPTEQEIDSLESLEERIQQTVQLVSRLRRERDAHARGELCPCQCLHGLVGGLHVGVVPGRCKGLEVGHPHRHCQNEQPEQAASMLHFLFLLFEPSVC